MFESNLNNKEKIANNILNDKQETGLIYLTSITQWNKARGLIDYLEDDSIEKTNMCEDIRATVREINRAQKKLF